MTAPVFEITKAASFDAAHSLPGGRPERPYARLHGHSFRVEATLAGPAAPPMGWVADLADLEAALNLAAGELDHTLLNEHAGLESPTLEALCVHFAGRLQSQFPSLKRIVVSRPSVGESCALESPPTPSG
jgi:6-pyruvoyltetrahydropterin/6-carboxytetrahydropterin synthase